MVENNIKLTLAYSLLKNVLSLMKEAIYDISKYQLVQFYKGTKIVWINPIDFYIFSRSL